MSNNLIKKVHYFIFYESIYQCAPWINSIDIFLGKGYTVNVFQQEKRYNKYNKFMSKDRFNIYEYKINILTDFVLRVTLKSTSFFSKIGILYPNKIAIKINDFVRTRFYIKNVLSKLSLFNSGDIFIAGDPVSLFIADRISKQKKGKLVFWNLELYIETELSNPQKIKWKKIEKDCSARAQVVLEFGHIRRELLIEENKLNPQKVFVIPNAPIGEGGLLRNRYFNDKFNIPLNKIIVLSAGGISGVLGINELMYAAKNFQEEFVFVIHSKIYMKDKHQGIEGKIYFNLDPLPYNKIDLIYSSCDIGVMIMRPEDRSSFTNHTFVDWSSGKLFNYLKFGKPILTNDIPGYEEFVGGNKIGEIFKNKEDIISALKKIHVSSQQYSENALRMYNELKFEKYHELFYNKVLENQ